MGEGEDGWGRGRMVGEGGREREEGGERGVGGGGGRWERREGDESSRLSIQPNTATCEEHKAAITSEAIISAMFITLPMGLTAKKS